METGGLYIPEPGSTTRLTGKGERAARKEGERLGCKKECWLGESSSVKSFRVEGLNTVEC